jgi:DnaJ family protein C protein 13
MIEYLLKLLESSMSQVDKPASVKAQIVKALKAMLNTTQYASQVFKFNSIIVFYWLSLIIRIKVDAILSASRIWKDYKDQKHDLFITTTTTAGYLTNSVPSVAGYLTAGPGGLTTSAAEKIPPPDLDEE